MPNSGRSTEQGTDQGTDRGTEKNTVLKAVRRTLRQTLRACLLSLPWVASLFVLYILETRGLWQPQTAFRAVASVALLAIGMTGSFLLHTVLARRVD